MFQSKQNVSPPAVRASGLVQTDKMATTSHVTDVASTPRAATG